MQLLAGWIILDFDHSKWIREAQSRISADEKGNIFHQFFEILCQGLVPIARSLTLATSSVMRSPVPR